MPTSFADLGEAREKQVAGSRLTNTKELILEIEDGVSISTVAEHLGVELQVSGEQWRGLCPLHEEGTPSFYVSDSKQQYHCFGCFVAGTMVLTKQGYVPIEEVRAGDLVVTHRGRLRSVTDVMVREADQTLDVDIVGAPTLRTTSEHPFYVRENIGRERLSVEERRRRGVGPQTSYGNRLLSSAKWVNASSLTTRHLAGRVSPLGAPVPPLPSGVENPRDFYWIVGRYLADGWRCKAAPSAGNRRMLVICCAHDEADELDARLRRVAHATRSQRRTTVEFTISRVEWYDWLEDFGDKAAHKRIPTWVYGLPRRDQEALLEGYLSGDGHYEDNAHFQGWRATSISKALALGIALMTQTVWGVVASVRPIGGVRAQGECEIEGRKVKQRPAFSILIPHNNSRPVVEQSREYGWAPVRGARPGPAARVYNLAVADDESYVVDNVVVHNCKAGGDMIDLVERVRHLGFIETLYYLAAEADVDVSAYERPMTEAEKQQEEFRSWCETWLAGFDRDQFPSRLPVLAAIDFGITVRPDTPRPAPPPYFLDKGYLLDGIILPWRTPSERLVGWRVRERDGQPKHIGGTGNDFPLGKTREETLFGIQVSRKHIAEAGGQVILVEGEYDTMALYGAGVRNVAGMGGSSLTEGQMKLLQSLHVREIVVVFDGDTGGREAAQAFAEKYWAHDIFVRVAVCPDGLDPEDVVKEQGDLGFVALAASGRAALEYILRLEWARRGRDTLTDKLEFVKWVRDSYGQKLRSTDESLVLQEVARWLEIPELQVRDYVRAADAGLCAVDSERLLLGRCCRDRQFYVTLRGNLARDDFFVLKHQRIWDILAGMLIDNLDFDAATLVIQAKGQGLPDGYIEGLLEAPDANWEWHRDQVADLSLRRSARDDSMRFKDRIQDLAQPADLLVGDLTHRLTTQALRKAGASQRQTAEQVDEAMDTLHERMRNPDEVHGIDLGSQLPRLSHILQGLQGGRLYQVAALSRIGKTSLLCHMCAAVAVHQSIPLDFVSLEMDETEILFKLAAHLTGIDSTKVSGGRLDEQEAQAVEYAMIRIRSSPLKLWCPDGLTASEFLLYARESVMQRRTQAFFLDYVQLIDPEPGAERENGYKLYGDFARLAKMKVARAMDVAVVCAAQLSREAANKERPTSEQMGDSYALVRHSNVVLILHGQEDASTLELWVDKNRGGAGGGLVPLIYDRPTNTFYEAATGRKQPEYLVTT